MKNATCVNDYCECDGSTNCEKRVSKMVTRVGLECELLDDCNIHKSECIKGKCICIPGYTYTDDGKRCITSK